ncbi:hypothetical protein [Deinococcus pimensis]|uniref:hypothetical protein n=1 Tax=Deinococcus pimensis TaxID=309888 RepID=UPI00048623CA|nr:hypothetical protein [Deinococcus pimensis]
MDAQSRILLDNLYRHVFVTFQALTRLQTTDRAARDLALRRLDAIHEALETLLITQWPHGPHLTQDLQALHARLDAVDADLSRLGRRPRAELATAL